MPEPVTPAATPPLTDEELKAQSQEFTAEFFDNERLSRHNVKEAPEFPPDPATEQKPAVEAVAPAPAEVPADAVPAEPAATPKPLEGLTAEPEGAPAAPEPAESPAVAPRAEIDPDDFAERVVDRLEARQKKPETPAAPANPYAHLSEADQKQLRVLDHLAKTSERYKGRDLVKEGVQFFNREAAYRDEWIKKNPGETFNPSDEAHTDFYSKFDVKVEADDIEEAKIDLRVNERASKLVEEQVNQRIAPIEAKARQAQKSAAEVELRPRIEQGAYSAVKELVLGAVPEFKDLLTAGRMDDAALKKMAEKDPEAVEQLDIQAQVLRAQVREVEAMVHLGDHFQFNENLVVRTPAGNIRPHADIINVGQELEAEFSAKPKEQRIRDGKLFAPQHIMQAMLDRAAGDPVKEKQLWDKYWIIGPGDIRNEFVRRSTENVKQILGVANRRIERVAKNGHQNGTNQQPAKPASEQPRKGTITPPSTSSVSDNVDTRIPAAPQGDKPEKYFADAMFN